MFECRRNWRAVPLPQKNMTRATVGAFVLVALTIITACGLIPAGGGKIAAGIAVFALLWLAVGIWGAHGAAFDIMAAFWWAVRALCCVALLVAHRSIGKFLFDELSLGGSTFWEWALGELR